RAASTMDPRIKSGGDSLFVIGDSAKIHSLDITAKPQSKSRMQPQHKTARQINASRQSSQT
ncbi:MAG: hypothetical protein ABWY00_03325, partial [Dongiaceae bacterium]